MVIIGAFSLIGINAWSTQLPPQHIGRASRIGTAMQHTGAEILDDCAD
jgi:hypothetical protein